MIPLLLAPLHMPSGILKCTLLMYFNSHSPVLHIRHSNCSCLNNILLVLYSLVCMLTWCWYSSSLWILNSSSQ